MTRNDVLAMLKVLKVAYPAFYSKMNAKDGADTVAIWEDMFRCEDVNVVKIALYKLIEEHTGYPPSIGDVKQKITELKRTVSGEPTDEELWHMLKQAVSNGYYGAKEEFEKLPSVLKRYLGSPSTLRELANGDENILNTVTHGQFLKQIGLIRERQEFADSLPEPVKEAVRRIVHRPENDMLSPAEETAEQKWNDARNAIVQQLSQNHK